MLQVQLSNVRQRRCGLENVCTVGVSNSERDFRQAGCAFLYNPEVACLIFAMDLERAGRQYTNLLYMLFAIVAVSDNDLFH